MTLRELHALHTTVNGTMIVNGELERIGKEVGDAYFKTYPST